MIQQRFYWPRHIQLRDNGTLTVKMTGYDEETTHWIDYLTVGRTDADYSFWLWLRQSAIIREVLEEQEVSALRNEFEQTLRRKHPVAA